MIRQADVVVVGAGPAGMAAACAARQHGQSVLVLDDNAAPGGQIWRKGVAKHHSADSGDSRRTHMLQRLAASGAEVLTGYRVFDVESPTTLLALREGAEDVDDVTGIRYRSLILATGARERFLPFPGWTLPGVFGAGGLEALVKGGFRVQGKRVVVAGSGPLLLAVAAHLAGYGARVVCVAEQAPFSQLARFAAGLLSHPEKLRQGIRYRAALGRAPYRTGCWPVAAHAGDAAGMLTRVELTDGVKRWTEPCDLLACGFHLVANTELASLLGCAVENGFVRVDAHQKTSVGNIYCAGEATGIGGLDAALLNGAVAGHSTAGFSQKKLGRHSAREKAFTVRLEKAFALRPELRSLAAPDTIVCRCEDVKYESLPQRTGWTDAKLQTRCGMGPCQGRVCGPATEVLFGWTMGSVRPPLFPVPAGAFSRAHSQQESHQEK